MDLALDNEPQLLQRIAKGDEKAFGIIFHHYKNRIYTIGRTYTEDRILSEELVQDVFFRVWKYRHQLTAVADFSAWLYVIARNRAITALEQVARDHRKKEAAYSYMPPALHAADSGLQERELNRWLHQAMGLLSPKQREVFELSRLKKLTRDEIAAELGISRATVSVHLTVALRIVRAYLSNYLDLAVILLLLHEF